MMGIFSGSMLRKGLRDKAMGFKAKQKRIARAERGSLRNSESRQRMIYLRETQPHLQIGRMYSTNQGFAPLLADICFDSGHGQENITIGDGDYLNILFLRTASAQLKNGEGATFGVIISERDIAGFDRFDEGIIIKRGQHPGGCALASFIMSWFMVMRGAANSPVTNLDSYPLEDRWLYLTEFKEADYKEALRLYNGIPGIDPAEDSPFSGEKRLYYVDAYAVFGGKLTLESPGGMGMALYDEKDLKEFERRAIVLQTVIKAQDSRGEIHPRFMETNYDRWLKYYNVVKIFPSHPLSPGTAKFFDQKP